MGYPSDLTSKADVYAHITEDITLLPGAFVLIPTGLHITVPKEYEIQIRPYSRLALNHGITVLDTPESIDEEQREEVGVILINHGEKPFIVKPGMLIARMVVTPVCRAVFVTKEYFFASLQKEEMPSGRSLVYRRFRPLLIKMRNFFTKAFKLSEAPNQYLGSIADYLDPGLILFLDVKNQKEALQTLVTALYNHKKIINKDSFYQAILNREASMSTGIGLGIAFPHARLPEYEDFFIVVGIQSEPGIEWLSLDGSKVHLIFMIGGPDNKQSEYLTILSHLTTTINDPETRKCLLNATHPQEVISLFKAF